MSCCGIGANGKEEEQNVSEPDLKPPESAVVGRHYLAPDKPEKANYFSAAYSESRFPLEGEADSQPIPFDKVLTQFPRGIYDPSRGMFTCRRSGAYMFNFSMRPDAPPIESLLVQLMKEDEPQVGLYVNADGFAGTSSQSCIIDVQQGEEVWVKLVHGAFRSDIRCPFATFSGTLLREIKK